MRGVAVVIQPQLDYNAALLFSFLGIEPEAWVARGFFLSESGLGWGKWETAVSLPRSSPRVALPLSFAVSTPHYSDRKKPLATQASTFRASLTGQQAGIFNNMQCPYERWTKVERENEGGGVGGGAGILIPTPPHRFLLHFFFWLRSTFLAANEF